MQKAVRRDLRFGAEIGREKPISAHVPYLRHVDEETLRTKDGMLLSIIKIDGFCHQTADQQIIDVEATARNTLVTCTRRQPLCGLLAHCPAPDTA